MNPSTALATVVVDELVRGGVREAVLCPGSRNAPLSFALHEADRQRPAAAARPDRRAHAPGSSRWAWPRRPGGRCLSSPPRAPPRSTCTRPSSRPTTRGCGWWCSPPTGPAELRGTGANQTIDQVNAVRRLGALLLRPLGRRGADGRPGGARWSTAPSATGQRRTGAPQRRLPRAAGPRRRPRRGPSRSMPTPRSAGWSPAAGATGATADLAAGGRTVVVAGDQAHGRCPRRWPRRVAGRCSPSRSPGTGRAERGRHLPAAARPPRRRHRAGRSSPAGPRCRGR